MYKGFVINLEKRPDRLSAFYQHNAAVCRFLDISRVDAADGSSLDLQRLKPLIDPWNFTNLAPNQLPGVVGCALSHIKAWQSIASLRDPFAFVFEDDTRIINKGVVSLLQRACNSPPEDADMIWFTDCDPGRTRIRSIFISAQLSAASFLPPRFERWHAEFLKCTEAYMITPAFARRLTSAIEGSLGAIDAKIRNYVRDARDSTVYCHEPPIFRQADRRDSNIR